MRPGSCAVHLTAVLLAAALVAGCSSVITPTPLGDPPSADREKFTGTWLVDKTAVAVSFASNGVGRLAAAEWDEAGQAFVLKQGEFVAAPGRPANFLSVRFEEEGHWTNAWHLLQYRFTDDGLLLLWTPRTDRFREAIEAGRLRGQVESGQYSTLVTVTNSPAELRRFLEDEAAPPPFDPLEPMILRRVGAPGP